MGRLGRRFNQHLALLLLENTTRQHELILYDFVELAERDSLLERRLTVGLALTFISFSIVFLSWRLIYGLVDFDCLIIEILVKSDLLGLQISKDLSYIFF